MHKQVCHSYRQLRLIEPCSLGLCVVLALHRVYFLVLLVTRPRPLLGQIMVETESHNLKCLIGKSSENVAVVIFLVLKSISYLLTGENKLTIRDAGIAEIVVKLEKEWLGSKDFEKHQAGFCSQWILDNICEPV